MSTSASTSAKPLPSSKRRRGGSKGGKQRKSTRPEYLQALVDEYQTTEDREAKRQILANLANFAYDPNNYKWLRALNITELFLDAIATEKTEDMADDFISFGIGGLCNLTIDMDYTTDLLKNEEALQLVYNCLASTQSSTICSALTTLYQLVIVVVLTDTTTTAMLANIYKCIHIQLDMLIHSTDKCISNLAILLQQQLQPYTE
ncbi:hypothetical protein BDF22DRAFT_774043 [Syncephalis plumigaleata]|nr:hypothetical protein BDF22DRAFT_774043 [Syncephalis plumigaleata]